MKKIVLILIALISTLLFSSCTKTTTGTIGWSELGGSGTSTSLNANGAIMAIAFDKSGNLYAAGSFRDANRNAYVAKWNGSAWSELGSGLPSGNSYGGITSMAIDNSGNIYVSGDFRDSTGSFYIAKWDGKSWSDFYSGSKTDMVSCITVDASNNIYAFVYFPASNRLDVGKWNGSSWAEVGSGSSYLYLGNAHSLSVDASGNVYAGIEGGSGTGLYKWNGSSWNLLTGQWAPISYPECTITDPGGNVYASSYRGINGEDYITKWNGSNWSLLDNGSTNRLNANNTIYTLARDASGNIYAAGQFTNSAGYEYVAQWDGKNWSELKLSPVEPKMNGGIQCLAVDPSGNVYAAGYFTNAYGYTYVAKFVK